jgi:hypothetical protein
MANKLSPEQQAKYEAYLQSQKAQAEKPKEIQFDSDQMEKYLEYVKKSDSVKGWSPEQVQKYENYVRDNYGKHVGDYALDVAKGVGDGALRAMDYLGGLSRTALGGTVGELMTDKNLVNKDDLLNALKGKAISSEEMLRRAGATDKAKLSDVLPSVYTDKGDGFTLKRGGSFDPSARAIAGFGLDIATDPTTYMGGALIRAASPLLKMKSGLKNLPANLIKGSAWTGLAALDGSLPNELLQKGGKKLYKSAFTNVDNAGRVKGKADVSDLYWDEGIRGDNRQIFDQSIDLGKKLELERDAKLALAESKGAKVDMGQATYPSRGLVSRLREDPGMEPIADQLESFLNRYVPQAEHQIRPDGTIIPAAIRDNPGPLTANQWKSNLYNTVGDSAYNEFKKTSRGQEFFKTFAHGMKEGIENAAEKVEPGLGKEIGDLNDKWGRILTTAKTLDNEAIKGERKHYLTSVDPILATMGMLTGDPKFAAKGILGKKAADLGKTAWFRTNAGMGLDAIGRNRALMSAGRHALINTGRPPVSPWALLEDIEREKKENGR